MSNLIKFFSNRRGGLLDLFIYVILSFVLVVCIGILYYAQSTISAKLYEVAPSISSKIGTNMTEILDVSVKRVSLSYENLKWISAFLLIGMFFSILIHSFLVKTKPVFATSYIFVWILAIVLSVYFSNVYESIYSHAVLVDAFSGFVGANWFMLNLPYIICIEGFIGGVLLFINIRRSGEIF